MNSYQKNIYIAIGVAIIIVGGIIFFNRSDKDKNTGISFLSVDSFEDVGKLKDEYRDPQNRFSFVSLDGYSVKDISTETDGEILLVSDTKNTSSGFQIHISQFDEPGYVLTADRLRNELPDLDIRDPRPIDREGNVIGISFVHGDSANPMREVWFAENAYLYQISFFTKDSDAVQYMLSTWKFM